MQDEFHIDKACLTNINDLSAIDLLHEEPGAGELHDNPVCHCGYGICSEFQIFVITVYKCDQNRF